MKKSTLCKVVGMCLILLVGIFYLLPTEAQQFLTSTQIFNQIFDSDSDSLQISIVTETITGDYTVGGDLTVSGTADIGSDITLDNDEVIDNDTDGTVQLQSDTALTNTVSPEFSLLHTTSGSPAAGIGTGISFVQETSAGNNETGMSVDAVVTDATAASEDFKFSVQLMAAGAAKAEKFSVSSVGAVTASGGADFGGDITLENDETISNSSDGTVLITSPIVEVSAALKLEFVTSDPCGTYPEGSIFYNDTSDVVCFCDGSGDDLKVVDGSACF